MSNHALPHNHGQNTQKVAARLPETEVSQILAEQFRQLSDPSRVRIFWLLCHCEECVINISAIMEMSSPAVSHHLRQLKAAGLIASRREGKEVYYRAVDSDKARELHRTIEALAAIACPQER